ncbi:MAG: cation:proton antiporter [Acidobacteria bacterium]|nr:cation:proton antiporter [Acidobacteriota bacterium]
MSYLNNLMVIFALSVGVVVVFNRLRLPAVVGYLVTGALAGPYGMGWVSRTEDVAILAEIGVALLLFTIGIEFSLAQLAKLRTTLLAGGGMQVLLTMSGVVLAGMVSGLAGRQAVFLGMLVALSSTAIVLKLLAERGEMDSPHGQISLAILIFQDLCVVPMTLLAPFLSGQQVQATEVLLVVGKAVVVVGATILAARYFVPWFFRQVVGTGSREIFLLSVILLCMGTAWLTGEAGLSLALGAFIAGLVISESEYSHQALGEILPFRNAFSGIFFVSVGMLFNARTALEFPLEISGGILALLLGKAVIVAGIVLLLGYSVRIAVLCGFGLAQVGEFSFVLATVGRQANVISEDLFQLFVGAAVLTMAATPLMWWGACRLVDRLPSPMRGWTRRVPEELFVARREEWKDHVIIAGFGINGRNLARVLHQVSIPYVVIEMNPETVRAERAKGQPILYGDVASGQILEHAGVREARVLVLAISDPAASRHATAFAHRINPTLHIIVRTRYVREMDALYAAGAGEVIPEEFETSIEIFSRVLRNYLVPRDLVERSVREIRETGYEMFRAIHELHRPAEDLRKYVRGLNMEIFQVQQGSPLEGRSLAEADLRGKTGATVLAVQRDSEVHPNPVPATRLAPGDIVLVLGTSEQLAKAGPLFID